MLFLSSPWLAWSLSVVWTSSKRPRSNRIQFKTRSPSGRLPNCGVYLCLSASIGCTPAARRAAFLPKAEESKLGRILVKAVTLLSTHNQTDTAKVLREATQTYKVDIEAISAQVKQEFAAKEKAKIAGVLEIVSGRLYRAAIPCSDSPPLVIRRRTPERGQGCGITGSERNR